jgi:hypothetical protein
MTPNQFANLVKSGAIPTSDAQNMMVMTEAQFQLNNPPGRIPTQSEIDAANNTPANYMQILSTTIAEDKALGLNTSLMQSGLNEMNALQGTTVGVEPQQSA